MSHIDCPSCSDDLNPVQMTRRHFLSRTGTGIGVAALSSLLPGCLSSSQASLSASGNALMPHFAPRAKRIIYLFQSGGPAQMELFDYKPLLKERMGEDLPASVRMGQRLTGMTANQAAFPLQAANWEFRQHGQSGTWVSDILPHTAKIVDDLCFVKSLHTEAINHDPAMTFFQTGSQQSGRPSMGAWLSYGLGSDNDNLPAYCVLLSKGTGRVGGGLGRRVVEVLVHISRKAYPQAASSS